ncbi:hypothetical protein [Williamsia phyllosphaerae]|uniref:HTH tetR-type domain-containing protein n=1 Tax=Williamsia phyllosphaerae TaxID=885042 RepID=A0ABQ1UKH3_9NOCA|nr:hypothetical protein [Williamsia phyllosphaerae]GGF18946.1 hypothetical protein GCM10007298_13740 [Williamsia phyllosphaerae]
MAKSEKPGQHNTGRGGDRHAGRAQPDKPSDVIIKAAVDAVHDAGLEVGLTQQGFEDTIRAARVSRSTAYRRWDSKKEFTRDLILELARTSWIRSAVLSDESVDAAFNLVATRKNELESEEGRLDLLRDSVMVGVDRDIRRISDSVEWRSYVSFTSLLYSSDEQVSREALDELEDNESVVLGRISVFVSFVFQTFGIRLRKEYEGNYRLIPAIMSSMIEGFTLRLAHTSDLREEVETKSVGSVLLPAYIVGNTVASLVEAVPGFSAVQNQMAIRISERYLATPIHDRKNQIMYYLETGSGGFPGFGFTA